eukprot:g34920.t1
MNLANEYSVPCTKAEMTIAVLPSQPRRGKGGAPEMRWNIKPLEEGAGQVQLDPEKDIEKILFDPTEFETKIFCNSGKRYSVVSQDFIPPTQGWRSLLVHGVQEEWPKDQNQQPRQLPQLRDMTLDYGTKLQSLHDTELVWLRHDVGSSNSRSIPSDRHPVPVPLVFHSRSKWVRSISLALSFVFTYLNCCPTTTTQHPVLPMNQLNNAILTTIDSPSRILQESRDTLVSVTSTSRCSSPTSSAKL